MSFVLNKLAMLLTTLVVVGVALFWSSAAEAHTGHATGAVVATLAIETSASAEAHVPNIEAAQAAETKTDKAPDAPHRAGNTTCCGTGVSNCMAATLACPQAVLAGPQPSLPAPASVFRSLVGVTVDGLIRPPKALV